MTNRKIFILSCLTMALCRAATPSTKRDVYIDYHDDSILKHPIRAMLVIPKLAEHPEGEYVISLSNGMIVKVNVPYLPLGRDKIEVRVTVTPKP